MASVILDADKISKEKSKWGDGNKVYTRRSKTTTNNNVAATVTAAEHADSETHQNDNLVQSREPTGNGVTKPVVSLLDGWVKINLKAAKSKDEVIKVMETMKAELDKIRSLARKLEDKEAEVTAFTTVVGVANGDAYSRSHYLGNDTVDRSSLLRINSEMGSATNGDIRPFQQLSVSVGNNNNNYGVGEFVEIEKRTPKANPYYQRSNFFLGKDRLPAESNKRQKSNKGRKHTPESKMFTKCKNLLQRLMKHKYGWVFNKPVNAETMGLHDYHDIIKHPMDLGTIKSRLAQNFYKSPVEFVDDVRLTFHNAMTYNPKGHEVHVMAEQVLDLFEERWAVIESESNPKLRNGMIYDPNTPTPTSRNAPHFAHAPSTMVCGPESMSAPAHFAHAPSTMVYGPEPMSTPAHFAHAPSTMVYGPEPMSTPVMARQKPSRTRVPKKPKANDRNKRNMTYEEKQKLSSNLQSLPSEKLDNIVQIIKKNTSVTQQDDEIEVDIDSVDVETLWELDRFVTNFRKNSSKRKRKAELAQQARAEAGDVNINPTVLINPANSIPEHRQEDKTTGEKTLASQGERRGDNASSSSSSSSDSGSSSSDSDSDSSSEDGSDAGHSPKS